VNLGKHHERGRSYQFVRSRDQRSARRHLHRRKQRHPDRCPSCDLRIARNCRKIKSLYWFFNPRSRTLEFPLAFCCHRKKTFLNESHPAPRSIPNDFSIWLSGAGVLASEFIGPRSNPKLKEDLRIGSAGRSNCRSLVRKGDAGDGFTNLADVSPKSPRRGIYLAFAVQIQECRHAFDVFAARPERDDRSVDRLRSRARLRVHGIPLGLPAHRGHVVSPCDRLLSDFIEEMHERRAAGACFFRMPGFERLRPVRSSGPQRSCFVYISQGKVPGSGNSLLGPDRRTRRPLPHHLARGPVFNAHFCLGSTVVKGT